MNEKAFDTQTLKKSLNDLIAAADAPDGLSVVSESESSSSNMVVKLPERLLDWLIDLRLLRGVPLGYLVPDPELLPAESIRFFHIDRTWADRLIDGALSAANIGTVDTTFTVITLTKLRQKLDQELQIQHDTKLSGMLIRSELVTRWPDLMVRAKTKNGDPIDILRHDVLSQAILIVLFKGIPHTVEIREPDVGLRFGVEGTKSPFKVNKRKVNGDYDGDTTVDVHAYAKRVIDVQKLKTAAAGAHVVGDGIGSREVALHLQQQAYVAVYSQDVPDKDGSVPARQRGIWTAIKFANGTTKSAESLFKGRMAIGLVDGGE